MLLSVTAYKGALTMAGAGTCGTVPPAIATFITTAMKQHTDHAAAWNGVLTKASLPAQTSTFATANVTDPAGIMTAASIQPVETMHAAILSFVLGEYPVPLSFIGISGAVQPSALTA